MSYQQIFRRIAELTLLAILVVSVILVWTAGA